MIAYLDTHVVVWLCENKIEKITNNALDAINAYDLFISPMVLIELNFLNQIGKILRAPLDLRRQLRSQIGVRVCNHSFPDLAENALFETWTRDPFDLMIVAHAKANSFSPLITADGNIRRNYINAVW